MRKKMRPAASLALVVVLAILIPIIPFAVIGELPGERWLSATDDSAWLFAVTGTGLLAADVLLPIPSSILGTMLGARLGFLPGWLCAWLGLVAGNAIGYLVGRLLLSRLASKGAELPTLLVLFISRPVPVLAEALTFTAGAEKMNFIAFILVSIAGNGIYAIALAGNGAALLPDSLAGPGLILPMSLPVAAWLAWRWLERKRKTRRPAE
jgi:uncharacterized membrane protein YdjX (TVP38/TMEM64 family)